MNKILDLIERIMLIGFGLLLAIGILSIIILSNNSIYYVQAYKSELEIAQNDLEALRSRLTPIDINDLALGIEWNTYDNKVINQAPYKLFFVIKSIDLEACYFISVKNYVFDNPYY